MVTIATVKFIASKRMQSRQGLASILAYCKQDKKTLYNGRKLVSGVNCVAESAFNEMMNTKIQYRKTDGRMYYHLFQSFHPDEPITPVTAHEIALKFAQEQFKGYEVLVATHIDREHIHSHFIVNSVSAETGLKYHPDKNEIQRLRDYSDNLCREYGLSVVIPKLQKVKQMSAREYRSADKGQSWKLQLAIAIDEAMKYATSKAHFISLMENEGYEVKWTAERKSITYTTPHGMKCRDNKLHEEKYLKESMENEFRIREEITAGIKGTSQETNANRLKSRTLRSGYGAELESVNFNPDSTDRYAEINTGRNFRTDYERGNTDIPQPSDEFLAEVYRQFQCNGTDLQDGASGYDEQLCQPDKRCGEECLTTGWEYEREVFIQYQSSGGETESSCEDTVFPGFDTDSYYSNNGNDIAYLVADLTNILDNDHPVEDCTTMKQPRKERKNTNNSNPRGGFNMSM